jgi:putative tricarboxylic transport membrane protein
MSTELITRVLWTALGTFIAVRARSLGLGSLEEPGPGMLAFGLGITMAVVAAADGLRPFLRRKASTGETGMRNESGAVAEAAAPPQPPMKLPMRQFAAVAVLLAYIALLEPAGFALSTFAFLLVLFLMLSPLSWLRAFAFSVLGSALSYAVFKYGLGVQLPVGLLG